MLKSFSSDRAIFSFFGYVSRDQVIPSPLFVASISVSLYLCLCLSVLSVYLSADDACDAP